MLMKSVRTLMPRVRTGRQGGKGDAALTIARTPAGGREVHGVQRGFSKTRPATPTPGMASQESNVR